MMITSNKKCLLLTTLGLIVVFVAGFFANTLYQKSQETMAKSVAKSFVANLATGDTSKAYTQVSSKLKVVQNSGDFDKAFGVLKSSAPAYEASSIVKAGNAYIYQQSVDGLPQNASGVTQADFAVTLVRQGASWKVDNVIIQ